MFSPFEESIFLGNLGYLKVENYINHILFTFGQNNVNYFHLVEISLKS